MKDPNDSIVTVWKMEEAQRLATALTLINDLETMQQFLRDVMTENEIIEISSRLEAARLLRDGVKYMDIIERTKLSSRTVARISEWLQGGCGGYTKSLDMLEAHTTTHTLPAHAE